MTLALPASIQKYAKAVIAVAGAIVVIGQAILAPGADIVSIVTVVLTALGVYQVPNAAPVVPVAPVAPAPPAK